MRVPLSLFNHVKQESASTLSYSTFILFVIFLKLSSSKRFTRKNSFKISQSLPLLRTFRKVNLCHTVRFSL